MTTAAAQSPDREESERALRADFCQSVHTKLFHTSATANGRVIIIGRLRNGRR
jgi:hypothetical protein